MRRGRVHLVGKRAIRDATYLEIIDNGQQLAQGTTEPVQLPRHEAITGAQALNARIKTWTVVPCPVSLVGMQMLFIDAGGDLRDALLVDGLPIIGRRNTHVTNKYVRKAPKPAVSAYHCALT